MIYSASRARPTFAVLNPSALAPPFEYPKHRSALARLYEILILRFAAKVSRATVERDANHISILLKISALLFFFFSNLKYDNTA